MRLRRTPARHPLPWVYDDGGRAAAGLRSTADDCVVRALAIATGLPYLDVRTALGHSIAAHRGLRRGASETDRGMFRHEYDTWLVGVLGWRWTPTMGIGMGCTVHMAKGELPDVPVVVTRLSKHLSTVVHGVVHDTHDPCRDGSRCVYGYYLPPEA